MAGNRGSGFWNEFFNDDERSNDVEVIYGNMLPEFHDLYYSTVSESDTYAEMNDIEKLFMADEFMELFYYGGYSAADQETWLAELGLHMRDFDWDEYATLYDSLHG